MDENSQKKWNLQITAATTPRRKEKPPPPWVNMNWFERILFCIKVPVRAVWCTSNIAMFFLVYFGFMLPVVWFKTIWPRLYWAYEGKLYRWLQAFIGYWGYTAGYDVVEYGDDVKQYGEEERVLMMINHQSTADVPVLMTILQSKGVACRKTLWLMDIMFRWTPFGIIGHNHGDYFIMQGKA
uniref:Phospholipid/glycerol acyltransferase domain-containing protein n=1 Tax=Plectus sambesii TaxID=2011161 RepID=A0A914UTJ1_9BILA